MSIRKETANTDFVIRRKTTRRPSELIPYSWVILIPMEKYLYPYAPSESTLPPSFTAAISSPRLLNTEGNISSMSDETWPRWVFYLRFRFEISLPINAGFIAPATCRPFFYILWLFFLEYVRNTGGVVLWEVIHDDVLYSRHGRGMVRSL